MGRWADTLSQNNEGGTALRGFKEVQCWTGYKRELQGADPLNSGGKTTAQEGGPEDPETWAFEREKVKD